MHSVRNAYVSLVGNPGRKGPVGRPTHRWEDNIKTDLREARWEGVNWMNMVQNRNQ